jgi:hypothetical protein
MGSCLGYAWCPSGVLSCAHVSSRGRVTGSICWRSDWVSRSSCGGGGTIWLVVVLVFLAGRALWVRSARQCFGCRCSVCRSSSMLSSLRCGLFLLPLAMHLFFLVSVLLAPVDRVIGRFHREGMCAALLPGHVYCGANRLGIGVWCTAGLCALVWIRGRVSLCYGAVDWFLSVFRWRLFVCALEFVHAGAAAGVTRCFRLLLHPMEAVQRAPRCRGCSRNGVLSVLLQFWLRFLACSVAYFFRLLRTMLFMSCDV